MVCELSLNKAAIFKTNTRRFPEGFEPQLRGRASHTLPTWALVSPSTDQLVRGPLYRTLPTGLRAFETEQQQLSRRMAGDLKWRNPDKAPSPRTRPEPSLPCQSRGIPGLAGVSQGTKQPKRTERGANQTADKGTECLKRGEECLPESWAEKTQNYLLALVLFFTQVPGSNSFISPFSDFFYSLLTLLLHLFHLIDALAPLVKESKKKDKYLGMCLHSKYFLPRLWNPSCR